MYIAVAAVLIGWAVWFGSGGLLLYALPVIVAFHLRVLLYEEPRLASGFGEEWLAYRSRVRRWL
jgi:protein-S-isoprenylcysteine O-methyltransferase Ste14